MTESHSRSHNVLKLILSFLFFLPPSIHAESLTIAFWNVCNLFDTIDDPRKKDNDFTPNGKGKWTPEKLESKIEHLSEILRSLDADIVGLAEVENIEVLRMLAKAAGFENAYLKEREDQRGIDVGMLSHKPIENIKNTGPGRGFLQGRIGGLNLAFVHWKSKLGRPERTAKMRFEAALHAKNLPAQLIMGDFNEGPEEPGRKKLLDLGFSNQIGSDCVSFVEGNKPICIDSVYTRESECKITNVKAEVVRPAIMGGLTETGRVKKPDVTYSDHYPVIVKLAFDCKSKPDH